MLPVVLTDTSSGFFVINWLKCEFSSEIKWLIITHKLFVRCDLHCYVCWKTQWLSRVKIWFSSLFHYVQSQNVQRRTTPNQINPAVGGFYIYHCVQLGSTMSYLWSPCPGFCVRCRFFTMLLGCAYQPLGYSIRSTILNREHSSLVLFSVWA